MRNQIKNRRFLLLILITGMLPLALFFRIEAQDSPRYIGINYCKKSCHDSDTIGNQYRVWAISPHSKAFQELETGKAYDIGNKLGIKKPSESLECLKCHTTGGGNTEATKTEGVGCEACHGPGSLYYKFSNHALLGSGEKPYMKAIYRTAISLGMTPLLGPDTNSIRMREKICYDCHDENRPCAPEDFRERKKKHLPLSIIADFIFRHPVRK